MKLFASRIKITSCVSIAIARHGPLYPGKAFCNMEENAANNKISKNAFFIINKKDSGFVKSPILSSAEMLTRYVIENLRYVPYDKSGREKNLTAAADEISQYSPVSLDDRVLQRAQDRTIIIVGRDCLASWCAALALHSCTWRRPF